MPTFRNDGDKAVIYTEPGGKDIIIFDPGKNVQLVQWVPYQRLGLKLVNESYPPVPSELLLSGEYDFRRGMERKYDIEPCKSYRLEITPIEGAVSLYLGSSDKGKVINLMEYSGVHEWHYAPYIRVRGMSETSKISVQATREW
ncbi:MAG: hypothetical protein IJG37_00500 [Synergistaceae bacterium]|nr:hypothetical protein [Synergistaceae bacterium]